MRNPVRLTLVLAALAAILVAVAACGSATAPTASAPAAAAPQKPQFDFSNLGKGTDKIFVPVDEVKKAFDQNADMVIVDARPPSDYNMGHIKGAVNAPYFEVDKHLSKLPKDKWIITYCACPHAEAEQAARELLKNGYTKVKAIDEGYFAWVDKGWPVEKS